MRYISLLLLTGVLYWSWAIVQAPLAIPESTHVDIQDDIKMMIAETVQNNLPTVENFRFERFWTENLETNKVKAFFTFSFENSAEQEEAARYGIEGSAVLTYDEAKNVWNVEGPIFSNNAITFKNGLTIHPGAVAEE